MALSMTSAASTTAEDGGAQISCGGSSSGQKRGSNFGRVDALRWWLKMRHESPSCPGVCFQAQKSKRKPHERDMGDNLEVAVSRVTEWAAGEIERLAEGSDARERLTTMLQELPDYGSPRWGDFNEMCLIPLLKGLKEGTIGRKHRESEGVLLTDCQRAQKAQESLEHLALVVMHKASQVYEDARRISADPARAVRATKLLNKQALELSKLFGSNELPTDFTPPVAKMARLGPGGARAGSALLTFAAEYAARTEGDAESDASGEEEDEEPFFRGPPAAALQGTARAAALGSWGVGAARGGVASSVARARCGGGLARPAEEEEFSASQVSLAHQVEDLSSQDCATLGLLDSQESVPEEEVEDEPARPASRPPPSTPPLPPQPPLALARGGTPARPAEPSRVAAPPAGTLVAPAPAAAAPAGQQSVKTEPTPAGQQSVNTELPHPPHPAPSTSSPARLNAGPARGPAAASKRSGGANDIMNAAHGLRALRAMAGAGAAAGTDASAFSAHGPDAESGLQPKSVVDDAQARAARAVHTRSRDALSCVRDALSSR